jgi:hypothetical protein
MVHRGVDDSVTNTECKNRYQVTQKGAKRVEEAVQVYEEMRYESKTIEDSTSKRSPFGRGLEMYFQ